MATLAVMSIRNSHHTSEMAMATATASASALSNSNSMVQSGNDHHWDYEQEVELEEEEEERCQACHSTALRTDWSQGDRVCTNCGLVAESHVRDTRPEWKDFAEAEDLVKGMPSGARSGLVAVDESLYLGGLQPTVLSEHPFGGETNGGYGMAKMRKRLRATNKRLDRMMEKLHSKALKDTKLDQTIRRKRQRQHTTTLHEGEEDGDDFQHDYTVRPELENVLLHEEQEAHRLHAALYAEKWSLDRAILLYGKHHEQQRHATDAEMKDLNSKLDSTLRKASHDLYEAYSMLTNAARSLDLPDRVQMEVSHRLVRFATQKDGLRIPGIASRLNQQAFSKSSLNEQAEAKNKLKEYNLRKQMASLGAALLYLTSRSLGWTRNVAEICTKFSDNYHEQVGNNKNGKHPPLIKAKHVSRAIKEIQSIFPEYCRQPTPTAVSTEKSDFSSDAMAAANFAEHALQKLQLPPVAEASIQTLLVQYREEQVQSSSSSLSSSGGVTKLSTLCAAIAYLVCSAGAVMQKLAQQHQQRQQQSARKKARIHYQTTKRNSGAGTGTSNSVKRRKLNDPTAGPIPTVISFKDVPEAATRESSDDDDDGDDDLLALTKWKSTKSKINTPNKKFNVENDDDDDNHNDKPFDVFSHPAIVKDPSEKQEYELRRMWDAWAEQMSWNRSLSEVEQSCGVSRSVILNVFKTELYPRRQELLQFLADSVKNSNEKETNVINNNNNNNNNNNGRILQSHQRSLQDTPLATILMAHVTTAAPLMIAR